MIGEQSSFYNQETIVDASDELTRMYTHIDKVYTERNKLIALVMWFCLEVGLEAGVGQDPDFSEDDPWRNVVFFEVPAGQCSFHIHDSEMGFYSGLPRYEKPWDGHSTVEKFQRILYPGLDRLHMASWSFSGVLADTFATREIPGVSDQWKILSGQGSSGEIEIVTPHE